MLWHTCTLSACPPPRRIWLCNFSNCSLSSSRSTAEHNSESTHSSGYNLDSQKLVKHAILHQCLLRQLHHLAELSLMFCREGDNWWYLTCCTDLLLLFPQGSTQLLRPLTLTLQDMIVHATQL